ncbi:hypothetical protein L7F22_014175 [Adiantum nelumboides]|nr:hypothetical protein [Adiantum nelumboides]
MDRRSPISLVVNQAGTSVNVGEGNVAGLVQSFSHGDSLRRPIGHWPPLNGEGKEPWTESSEAEELKKQLEEARKEIFFFEKKLQEPAMPEALHSLPDTLAEAIPLDTPEGDSSTARVNLPIDLIREVEEDYAGRCLVGLLFGPRPPVEYLRKWMEDTWRALEVEVKAVQVLPKGYYIFLFKNRNMAIKVLGAGQWRYKSTPFCFFSWSKDFSASGPKPSACPVWIELPDLPYHMYHWADKIAGALGKVLGHKPRSYINPSWHPQALVEIDLAKPLKEEIYINCGEFSFKQKVLYKHLPNACFHCGKKGHVIKECPLRAPFKQNIPQSGANPTKETAPITNSINKPLTSGTPAPKDLPVRKEKNEEFTPLPKKKTFKQRKGLAPKLTANFYSLLEKPDNSDEDEEIMETIQETQLDGNRLSSELERMDENLGEDPSMQEVDDTPLVRVPGPVHQISLSPEQDIEMESLKELKRDQAHENSIL